ncbi:Deoxyribose-phosphate aldolase [Micromonospora noduli]|nr:Deoxyribose-phosphate aldolase [Micromonospora noduli]
MGGGAEQARGTEPADPSVPHVGAVCGYTARVRYVGGVLRGRAVHLASVATAFPSGQAPLEIKLADTGAAVAAGADGGPMLDELARRLALGVASTCVVLDPPLVVLAGEVGQAGGAALADRVQQEVAAITLVQPRVVPTGLTEEPILQGALRTALDAVRDEVFGSTVG